MAFSDFQFSNGKVITSSETWTSELGITEMQYEDVLGARSRILTVTVANPNNNLGARYSAYQRVRVIERLSETYIFLGRIDQIVPDHRKQEIKLVCRDYTSDLAERSNAASSYTDVRRSEIVKDIIGDSTKGVFGSGATRNIASNFHVDDSNYLELIERVYGNGVDGFETLLDSIEKLAQEEPWSNARVLFWPGAFGGIGDNWWEFTAEAWSGNSLMRKPQFTKSGGGAGVDMRLYVGSTAPFGGLNFVLELDDEHDSLDVEFWNGTSWQPVISLVDGTDNLQQNGNVTWDATSIWVTKDDLTGEEAFDTIEQSTILFHDDPATTSLTDSQYADLYWVRVMVNRTVADANPNVMFHVHVLDFDGRPADSRWDYGMQDPCFFNVVGDGDGAGSWNDNATNSYDRTTSTNFNFLADETRHFYFGLDFKFGGLEFDLSTLGNYTGRTFTWEYWDGSAWTSITDDASYDFSTDIAGPFWDADAITWVKRDLQIAPSNESGASHDSLYYMRVSIDAGAVTTTAVISTVKTVSIASFKFWERGTEPWNYNFRGTVTSVSSPFLADTAATFDDAMVGGVAVNLVTNATANIINITGTTVLTLSAHIFLVNGEGYMIQQEKKGGSKANESIESTGRHNLTLEYRGISGDAQEPIYRYQLGERPVEFVTRVIVHGNRGVKGQSVNSARETTYGIIKEHIVYDWDLDSTGACQTRADSILKSLEPGSTTTIRRGLIELYHFPTFTFNSRPTPVRAGDIINVTITDGQLSLSNERFLVWGVQYDDGKSLTALSVTQDLIPSNEETLTRGASIKALSQAARNESWNGSVPSASSAKEFLFHNSIGAYSPEARLVQNNIARASVGIALQDDGGVFTDETVDANSSADGDVDPFPAVSATGDAFYLGFAIKFPQVRVNRLGGTQGVGGVTAYEYSQGSGSWGTLAELVDGTATGGGFGNAVLNDSDLITFTVPSDWVTDSVNGSAQLFFIRFRVTTIYTTEPILSQIFISSENQDTIDLENFIGGDDENTNPYSGTGGSNWEQALRFFYARGGALGFVGSLTADEGDINAGNGRLYYNQDDDLFKARVELDEVDDPTFRWVAVGEWGTATVDANGEATVTFQDKFATKPLVLLTVDQDTASAGSGFSAEIESWFLSGSDYTGVFIRAFDTANAPAPINTEVKILVLVSEGGTLDAVPGDPTAENVEIISTVNMDVSQDQTAEITTGVSVV